MFKKLKLLYQYLKGMSYSCINFIRNKGRALFLNLFFNPFNRPTPFSRESLKDILGSNYFVDMVANKLVGKELDKYLRSLKPAMPLINYDPAIKSMTIEWKSKFPPRDEPQLTKERFEEQIINRYVRYVSRHIFVLLQPSKHKILLNATAYAPMANYQVPIGEQVFYKDPQQLEDYLIDHLMAVLISYETDGVEDFIYFISNVDENLYQELSIKIKKLFEDQG